MFRFSRDFRPEDPARVTSTSARNGERTKRGRAHETGSERTKRGRTPLGPPRPRGHSLPRSARR
jgi:hypothetical protein